MSLSITPGLIAELRRIVLAAGDEVMKVYKTDFDVIRKEDRSPVTEADHRAEEVIEPALRAIWPDVPVVAEEAFAAGNAPEVADVAGRPFWLVDPLDGTKQFVSRKGEFTVNIGLIDGGVPVLGVVHAPALGVTYWGGPDGAGLRRDGEDRAIRVRRAPDDGIVAVVSRSHRGEAVDDFLRDFTVAEEVSSGSSIKFCLVAEGRADLYPRFGPTMEWDTAAGHAVVAAAGGRVTTPDGGPLRYAKPGFRNGNFIVWGEGLE